MKYRAILFFAAFFAVVSMLTAVLLLTEQIAADTEFFASVKINEIDYDQTPSGPSLDGSEFVELVNVGTSAADLDQYSLVFAHGLDNSRYMTVELPALTLQPGNYFVVCSNELIVVNCDFELGGLIADGNDGNPNIGDAVGLVLGNELSDSMSYEGNVAQFTETSGVGLEDDGSELFKGLSRIPDGNDTGENNIDFSAVCITPGLPNIAQNSGCDELLAPELEVTLTAVPGSIPEPGGTSTLTIRIDNLSILNISLTSLSDNDGQNLDGMGTCLLPQTLSGFGSYQCEYRVEVAGDFEDVIVRSVTAVGEDDFSVATNDTGQTSISISERIHWEMFVPVVASPLLFAEPNDTCAEAYFVVLNVDNLFKAEDAEDWYFFNLNTPTNLQVSLFNFVPAGGNLSVWSGSCGNLTRIGNDGSTAVNRTINLGTQPAGHYLIWLITDPPFNDSDLYNLRVASP